MSNQKIFLIFLILIILVTGALIFYSARQPKTLVNQETNKVVSSITNFKECAMASYPVQESYPRRCTTPDNKSFTEEIGNELEKTDQIQVDNPRPNQTIASPLEIKGRARGSWFFEAELPIKITDEKGKELGSAVAIAQSDWMTEDFVPFRAVIRFFMAYTNEGTLILSKSNPSDLPENNDELKIPVQFEKPSDEEKMTLQVYFGNSQMNPQTADCSAVFPVKRQVPKTEAVAKAALEELLNGPTPDEKAEGYLTNINNGVTVNQITIENGIAKADFDEQLQYQVGGSCKVAAIHSQIDSTLKQFSTVKEVIISINGKTEDILQP